MTGLHMADPKLRPNTNYCRYSGCGEYFNSEWPFKIHRVGKPAARKCLSPDEMRAKGMALSDKGYWVSAKRPKFNETASR